MSVLEIDLNSIKHNIRVIKSKLIINQKICLVAKANAYGLGDVKICEYLEKEVDYFAVSSTDEFLSLRKTISKPILILDPIYKNITKCAKKNAEFCVTNQENFNKVLKCAKRNKNCLFKLHIAINTGMNRFGFNDKKEIVRVIKDIKKTQNILICGVFSHYFDAKNKKYAKFQYDKLFNMKEFFIQNYDKNDIIFHIANTDGVDSINGLDMVRVGMGAYCDQQFQTVKLKSKIIDFKNLRKGDCLGYNRQFIATKNTKVAIVAIGYADGLFRNITNKGYVLINNKYCKILSICMDSIMVDTTNVKCKICDEVILIGRSGDKQIFICDLAAWCDTIRYEILTHITKRVKRKYIIG